LLQVKVKKGNNLVEEVGRVKHQVKIVKENSQKVEEKHHKKVKHQRRVKRQIRIKNSSK
jgi:hypothetical protein